MGAVGLWAASVHCTSVPVGGVSKQAQQHQGPACGADGALWLTLRNPNHLRQSLAKWAKRWALVAGVGATRTAASVLCLSPLTAWTEQSTHTAKEVLNCVRNSPYLVLSQQVGR